MSTSFKSTGSKIIKNAMRKKKETKISPFIIKN